MSVSLLWVKAVAVEIALISREFRQNISIIELAAGAGAFDDLLATYCRKLGSDYLITRGKELKLIVLSTHGSRHLRVSLLLQAILKASLKRVIGMALI